MAGRKIDPALREAYKAWLLTPPPERDPKTKLEMAEQLGVAEKTLYNWEGSEEFEDVMRQIKQKWGVRWYGDVLARLKQVIDEGSDKDSISAARVLLQHIDLGEKKSSTDATEDEVDAIRKALEAEGYKVTRKPNESDE